MSQDKAESDRMIYAIKSPLDSLTIGNIRGLQRRKGMSIDNLLKALSETIYIEGRVAEVIFTQLRGTASISREKNFSNLVEDCKNELAREYQFWGLEEKSINALTEQVQDWVRENPPAQPPYDTLLDTPEISSEKREPHL